MNLALSNVPRELEALLEMRADLLTGSTCAACLGTASEFNPCPHCESTGTVIDTEAFEQVELALKQYANELLPNKVDAYWWILSKLGKKDDSKPLAKQTGLIADAKREIKRLQAAVDQWDALQESLRETVLAVMRSLGKKKLEGSNGRALRRQANGGVQPVDVVQPELVPYDFQRITVTMPVNVWRDMMGAYDREHVDAVLNAQAHAKYEPNLTAIREELERKVPCQTCNGKGYIVLGYETDGDSVTEQCGDCDNGEVNAGVPGCVLRPRGESLRIV
jgi:hypothetical protein